MLKILFLTDKDLLYFMGGKVQSAKTYLTWCFCEVITNQIMICKLLMSIRCREGVVLYSSKYKNKYIYIYIYIYIFIKIYVSDIRIFLFWLENLKLRGYSGTQIWRWQNSIKLTLNATEC